MPYEVSLDPLPMIDQPACVHLRSKQMYVTDPAAPMDAYEAAARHWWCNLTQHVIGPDTAGVTRGKCIPGRDCYRDCH
jgi:hypothetical protein